MDLFTVSSNLVSPTFVFPFSWQGGLQHTIHLGLLGQGKLEKWRLSSLDCPQEKLQQ